MSTPIEYQHTLMTFPGQEKVVDSPHPEKTLVDRILEPYDRLVGHVGNLRERIIMYGNSFGIFAALAATEAMDREDAKNLAFRRGEIVRATEKRFEEEEQIAKASGLDTTQLGRTGMMRLLNVPAEIRQALMEQYQLFESNNYGGIVVLTGTRNALNLAADQFDDPKKATMLGIDAAYHDPRRTPDSLTFSHDVENARINPPKRPILTSTNARFVEHPDDIREELVGMMVRPVNLADVINAIRELGIAVAADLDPNESFAKLTKRFEDVRQWLQVNSPMRELETFNRIIRASAPAR